MAKKFAASIDDPTSKKLWALADHIEQMPHQPDFARATEGKHEFNMFRYAEIKVKRGGSVCGSVCCIAGEALRVFEPKTLKACYRSELSFIDEGARVLGLPADEVANDLFCGNFIGKELEDITPKEAADELRRLSQKYAEREA